MAKVRCTIQHASDLISGIEFYGIPGNKLSGEISNELAAQFARVPGFEVIDSVPVDQVAKQVDLVDASTEVDAVADKPRRGRKKAISTE